MLHSAVRRPTPVECAEFDATLKLLLACAKAQCDPEADAGIGSLCGAGVDWSRLVELSERHALLPLVHRALVGQAAVPEEIQQQLARSYLFRSARNLLLAHYLHELLAEFKTAGIAVFVHKGLAIGAMAYGDVMLRHAGDLDLVIPRPDLARARRVLESMGYAAKTDAPNERGYHLGFRRKEPDVVVELHWALTSSRWPFDIDDA